MTFEKVKQADERLKAKRIATTVAERQLSSAVSAFLMMRAEALRPLSKMLGISVPYLSDIIHGRRKVPTSFLDRLAKLK